MKIEKTPGKTGHKDETIASPTGNEPVGAPEMSIAPRHLAMLGAVNRDDDLRMERGGTPRSPYIHVLSSIDELLARDLQREKDGFPRKIRIGRIIKPVPGGNNKVVLVPTTVEEKFYHDTRVSDRETERKTSGSGEGDEGQVIAEEPLHATEEAGMGGPGHTEGESHDIESNAYDLGRILTEQFALPNLKEKGKKRSLKRYTYDLTDRHHGFGQVLDKKATLRKIIETNINLERITDPADIDLTSLLVSPTDSIYRILSREKDYESQAMVFFIRDYSGSMSGKPTNLVVTQHVLIYSWLVYQYQQQVTTRFILHDVEAKEVPDFYTYASLSVAGGTRIEAAYRLINRIVETHSLARDYNIYVFQGTDGDDSDADGSNTLPELRKILGYASRVGITVIQGATAAVRTTTLEKYLGDSQILADNPSAIQMDTVEDSASESRLIDGIKKLIS
jgi:uncharacterized sporulation protein YeaH/YhbH (DUF444 family)